MEIKLFWQLSVQMSIPNFIHIRSIVSDMKRTSYSHYMVILFTSKNESDLYYKTDFEGSSPLYFDKNYEGIDYTV